MSTTAEKPEGTGPVAWLAHRAGLALMHQPLVPWCRWDEGGDHECAPVPDPVPPGREPDRVG